MAGNPFLAMALAATIENPLVLRAYQGFDREQLARSALFHQLIVDAICKGDAGRAARLMTEHILQARDTLIEGTRSSTSAQRTSDESLP